MKKNLLVFMLTVLLIPSAFAPRPEGDSVINLSEIQKNLQDKVQNKEVKTYLNDSALDYFKSNAVIVFDGNTNTYIDMDHPMYGDNESILSFMEYRTDYVYKNNINIPILTDQFDIMTYLIYTGSNDSLKDFLNRGWAGSMYVDINLSDGATKTINLLTQAVLSGNKEALKIIKDSIAKKDSLIQAYQIALIGLIPESVYSDFEYNNDYLKGRYAYAKNNLTAEGIAQTVIDGDIITLYQYVDIIENKSKNAELLFDALNLLIDYRLEHGYK